MTFPSSVRGNAPLPHDSSVVCGNTPLPQNVAYLEKRDAARNLHRYYRVTVVPTLFGEWATVREWGRIGRRGGRMEEWFEDLHEAIAAGQEMAALKHRRGYR